MNVRVGLTGLCLLLLLGLTGCQSETDESTPVVDSRVSCSLVEVTANGGPAESGPGGQSTTLLTLIFDQIVDGLSAGDFTISGVAGARIDTTTGGGIGGTGPIYTLPITGFTTGGALKVAINEKEGYLFSGSPAEVEIKWFPTYLTRVIADGYASRPAEDGFPAVEGKTTTELVLTFSQAISGLSSGDLTLLLNGVELSTKGALGCAGPSYTLPISGFPAGGTLTVETKKALRLATMSAVVYYEPRRVTVGGITQDGEEGVTGKSTTKLTFQLSELVTSLTAEDIFLTTPPALATPPAVTKDSLLAGPPPQLEVEGFTTSGAVEVNIKKWNYVFDGVPREVPVWYEPLPVNFTSVEADQGKSATTTSVTLNFDRAINGLSADDITVEISDGNTWVEEGSITKGDFDARQTGPSYKLGINGLSKSKPQTEVVLTITVKQKWGYTITPETQPVTVYYVE